MIQEGNNMKWMNRNLQYQIIESLYNSYPKMLDEEDILKLASIRISDNPEQNREFYASNLQYLKEHGLITVEIIYSIDNLLNGFYNLKITAKGIDFIEQDGGLSAILNVVTVKLHSETIQQLLTAKISEAEIPEEEKNKLKEALKTVQNSALETLTEKAIETIPAMQVIGFLKAVVGL